MVTRETALLAIKFREVDHFRVRPRRSNPFRLVPKTDDNHVFRTESREVDDTAAALVGVYVMGEKTSVRIRPEFQFAVRVPEFGVSAGGKGCVNLISAIVPEKGRE